MVLITSKQEQDVPADVLLGYLREEIRVGGSIVLAGVFGMRLYFHHLYGFRGGVVAQRLRLYLHHL